ncbi:hypothetical protein LEP1GSC058_0437 [Leptospira fainei serovar Hurstbridge str. BUT 6]|uniref:Signal peptidase I n=1 Tax=Leptospira fainei serovar Hurstbridge str. BUT 6 TaxID=1193011 RepID=S3V394_9LEPT|nr:DUF5684 domain-containing protein [Leptospira fainei]EPG75893.1 hypothetical protein LEP1GSC058_0437 [Leptospira fainei serovar Hurstbridge str. BUT 6]
MEGNSGVGIVGILIYAVIIVAFLAANWKIYEKAGKPGWSAIIPIYNLVVLMEIVGKPAWWVILFFVPCVNLVVFILVAIELAKAFGKSAGFAVLFFVLGIGYFILGFSDAKYQGPAKAA